MFKILLRVKLRREQKVVNTNMTVYTCTCSITVFLGVYVPIGGKKLVTFMDDFNMPAKDTFGSQPPLELIRQWIDYGFWYDRQKQIVKQVKVRYSKDFVLILQNIFSVGDVFSCFYGPPWWWTDGDLPTSSEQIQPDQYDLSTSECVRFYCHRRMFILYE